MAGTEAMIALRNVERKIGMTEAASIEAAFTVLMQGISSGSEPLTNQGLAALVDAIGGIMPLKVKGTDIVTPQPPKEEIMAKPAPTEKARETQILEALQTIGISPEKTTGARTLRLLEETGALREGTTTEGITEALAAEGVDLDKVKGTDIVRFMGRLGSL